MTRRHRIPSAWNTLFARPASGSIAGGSLLAAAYGVGLFAWGQSLGFGRCAFTAFDWPKEVAYLEVLQQSVQRGRIPWHAAPPFQGTARFLANPEVPLSPQVLLLRWLSVEHYIVANWLAFYSLGFVGTLLLAQRLRLGALPTVLFFLLFSLNGYITAHLAAGHSMWTGYFLLPLWALALLNARRPCSCWPNGVFLGGVLAFGMAQGAFHIVAWLLGATVLFMLASTASMRALAIGLAAFVPLSAFRWMPAALSFAALRRPANPGYPSLEVLADAFVSIRPYDAPPVQLIGWWEYDMYLGYAGTLVLLVGGIYGALRYPPHRAWLLPATVFALFSMGTRYMPIADLPLPLVNAERGPTRFIIVPVFALLIPMAVAVDRHLSGQRARPRMRLWVQLGFLLLLAFVAYELHEHWMAWRLDLLERSARHQARYPTRLLIRDDPNYTRAVAMGYAITAAALLAWLVAATRRVKFWGQVH